MPQGSAQFRPQVSLHIVRADGGSESEVRMSADEVTFGRNADLSLDDPYLTDVQARFYFAEQRLAVEDLGSGNGVFLRIHQDTPLSPGTELRLGRQRFLVEEFSPEPARTPRRWGSPDPGFRFRLRQLLEGGTLAAAYPLKEGEYVVGRESGEICFPTDGFVSGRHAALLVREGHLSIRDLGSSNGTFVRLSGPIYLNDGHQLLIGRQLVKVEISPAA